MSVKEHQTNLMTWTKETGEGHIVRGVGGQFLASRTPMRQSENEDGPRASSHLTAGPHLCWKVAEDEEKIQRIQATCAASAEQGHS